MIGHDAKQDPSDGGNPLPLSADDYAAIFLAACEGKVHG